MPGQIDSSDLKRAGIGAFFRPRDVRPLGVSYYQIQRLVKEKQVERVGPGLYRLSAIETTELETIAMVVSAVPHAIVCLLSALRVHEIGSQAPREVWLAIDRKARKPRRLPAKVRLVRFSGAMLSYGVITRNMQGAIVAITSPARTVVDCFRYRNKIGLDVAVEALKDVIVSRKATVSQIDRAAEVRRIRSVIDPYLTALLA